MPLNVPSDIPNPIDVAVGVRLRLFRIQRQLSQSDLGSLIGVSFQQIQKYERGQNRISASTLYKISRIFQISPNKFFDKDIEEPKVENFTHDRHAQLLVENFLKIKDTDIQQNLLNLIKVASEKEDQRENDDDLRGLCA